MLRQIETNGNQERFNGTTSPVYDATVTVLTGTPGKEFSLGPDGTLDKTTVEQTGRYLALTRTLAGSSPAAVLAEFGALLASLTPAQTLILGHAVGTRDGDQYRILPQARLKEMLPAGTALPGVHTVGNHRFAARLKETFTPSRLCLFDHDPHPAQPAAWSNWEDDARWSAFTGACPEFAAAARLTVGSSSSRVTMPDGTCPKQGRHTYVLLHEPLSVADLDALRLSIEARLHLEGLGYERLDKGGATLRRTLFDTSVLTCGRIVFAGAPVCHAPLRVAPLGPETVEGGAVRAVLEVAKPAAGAFHRATGARVCRERASGRLVAVDSSGRLNLDTVIQSKSGVTTVRAFLDSGAAHLKCQTPYRESESWAGLLNRTPAGLATLYDFGSGILYTMVAGPEHEPVEDGAKPGKQAREIFAQGLWRVPWRESIDELLRRASETEPGADMSGLREIAERYAAAAASTARDDRRLDAETVPSIEAALQIARAHDGPVAIRAPHGAGKTQSVLRPLADEGEVVVAVAPRVSLVADLARRLHMTNYQGYRGEPTNSLAICLNSIPNELYAGVLGQATAVLIDEVAAVIRECHDPKGTMAAGGLATWRALCDLMVRAQTVAMVDADLTNADIRILERGLGRSVRVLDVDASPPARVAQFCSDAAARAAIDDAMKAGEPVLIVSDSARVVAGLGQALAAEYPESRVFAMHRASATGTAGSDLGVAVQEDVDVATDGLHAFLYSPCIASGVSLQSGRFKRHVALYTGVVDPIAFQQMLLRDRTARHWSIAVTGPGVKYGLPTTPLDVLLGLEARYRTTAAALGGVLVNPRDADTGALCRLVARKNRHLSEYGRVLFATLDAYGWQCRSPEPNAPVRRGHGLGRVATSEAARAAEVRAIVDAGDIDAAARDEMRESRSALSPKQEAEAARYDLRETTGQTVLDEPLADAWRGGRLRSEARAFDLLLDAPAPSERDSTEELAGINPAWRSLDFGLQAALQMLFSLVGIDLTDPERLTFDERDIERAWLELAGTDHGRTLRASKWMPKAKPRYLVRWFGTVLRRLGLSSAAGIRSGSDGARVRVYVVAAAPTLSRLGRMTTPGLDLMHEWRAARSRPVAPVPRPDDEPVRPDAHYILPTVSSGRPDAVNLDVSESLSAVRPDDEPVRPDAHYILLTTPSGRRADTLPAELAALDAASAASDARLLAEWAV